MTIGFAVGLLLAAGQDGPAGLSARSRCLALASRGRACFGDARHAARHHWLDGKSAFPTSVTSWATCGSTGRPSRTSVRCSGRWSLRGTVAP